MTAKTLMNITLSFSIDDQLSESLKPLVGKLEAVSTAVATSAHGWTGTLPCGRVSHADALKQIAILNENKFQGHADWRLPEVWELFSRVDHTRSDPATADPDVKASFHWSNTAYAPYPAVFAWGVGFYYGGVYDDDRDGSGFVRAVRGPVAARPGQ